MWMPRRSSAAFLALALLTAPVHAAALAVLAPASAAPGLRTLADQFTAQTGVTQGLDMPGEH